MSDDSGDEEFPNDYFSYLNTRAILLLNLTLLRGELNGIWKEGKKWSDKKFEAHLHTIAERRREILDIAHSLMSSDDYKKYEDFVNVLLPTEYSKKFDFKKLGPKRRKF